MEGSLIPGALVMSQAIPIPSKIYSKITITGTYGIIMCITNNQTLPAEGR
jgi:hypothetical protein